MNIDRIIEEFLLVKPEGYEKDIRVFINSLKSKNIPIIKEMFQGLRTKNIIESIDYYIEESKVKSVSPVKRYASALSEFFKFIIGNGHIDNKSFYDELLLPTIVKGSYWGEINDKLVKDKRLKEKDTFEILTKDEVKDLINSCDELFYKYIQLEEKISKQDYNTIIATLCIKLIALTGVTYREIREIKLTEDIEMFNKISINNFRIYLPEKYSIQLKKYLNLRNNILLENKKKSDYLFLTFKADQLSKQTNLIARVLGTCTGRNDLNGLIKYAIREMILAGVNDSVINRLTDAGIELIQQSLNNENIYNEIYWNKYLDTRLRTVDSFDLI